MEESTVHLYGSLIVQRIIEVKKNWQICEAQTSLGATLF